MKRVFAFFITVLMLFQSVTLFAAETDVSNPSGNVEISFKLGDSVLSINGSPVKVETPFAENGTTLVPLRVITEAFGADVFWDDGTKQITLNYGDTTIVLKIGDIYAYVNGQRQTLLLAPRISNGSTMVPLRFITETFGAVVGWNDSDGSILVTFSGTVPGGTDTPIDDISSLLQRSDKAKIGDSYYKWSIDMPGYMDIVYQSFDGRAVYIEPMNDNAIIYIDVYENTDNLTLAAIKTKETKYMQGSYTMVGQEVKTTKSGVQYVSTQGRDKQEFTQSNVYLKGSIYVVVDTYIDIAISSDDRQKYLDIADSFDFTFDAATTYDVSNVEDGYRLFDDETYNVQFRMPADWYDDSYYTKENQFRFIKLDKDYNEIGSVGLVIYSISNYKTAMDWAQAEFNYAKGLLNSSMVSFTQLTPITIAGQQGYTFSGTLKNNGIEYVVQEIYFYYEGYAYNITIRTRKGDVSIKDKIISSFKVSKIDASVVGKLAMPVRETADATTTYENKTDKYKITVPASWDSMSYDNSVFADEDSFMIMGIVCDKTTNGDFSQSAIDETVSGMKDMGFKVTSQKKSGKVNNEIIEITGTATEDSESLYVQINVFTRGDKTFVVMTMIPELAFSETMSNKIYKAINSIEVIK